MDTKMTQTTKIPKNLNREKEGINQRDEKGP